ncbi:MAG: outer membrane beta-barrel family protein [Cyclobacteriaceae bacterium]
MELYQRAVNEEGDQNTLMQIDYVYPFNDGKKFESGYRGTLRKITSDYLVEQLDDQGDFQPVANFSNLFVYNEDVHALYSIFENKMETWGYQLGLRIEQTVIETYQRETSERNKKEYLNAFPSAFISYNLNTEKTFQASYSRRLSRPRFWYLNPFSSFSDPRNIRQGNTDLNPEYSDSYEVGVLNNLNNSSIYLGGYYRYTTGVIDRIQTSVDGINTISIPRNIGVENAYGIEANFSSDPLTWLNINGNANFYRAITEGRFNDIILSRDTYTARFRLNSKFKIGKVDLQLSGNYRAPEKQTQGTRKSVYRVDLGANLDVLKGNGTINLSARDLFNSRKYRGTTVTDNFREESEFQWRSRQIRLSFTYRLKQKKNRGERDDREDGFEDEGEF